MGSWPSVLVLHSVGIFRSEQSSKLGRNKCSFPAPLLKLDTQGRVAGIVTKGVGYAVEGSVTLPDVYTAYSNP